MPSLWYVYILRCADNSLYTGITTDLTRRLEEHNFSNTLAAKYTRVRRPVSLAYCEPHPSRSDASSKEYKIKKLKKSIKELMVKEYLNNLNEH